MKAVAPAGADPDPATKGGENEEAEDELGRRPRESITDYGAVAFVLGLFILAIGLMYLIGHGRA